MSQRSTVDLKQEPTAPRSAHLCAFLLSGRFVAEQHVELLLLLHSDVVYLFSVSVILVLFCSWWNNTPSELLAGANGAFTSARSNLIKASNLQ